MFDNLRIQPALDGGYFVLAHNDLMIFDCKYTKFFFHEEYDYLFFIITCSNLQKEH